VFAVDAVQGTLQAGERVPSVLGGPVAEMLAATARVHGEPLTSGGRPNWRRRARAADPLVLAAVPARDGGGDPAVREASHDGASGTFTIPARTGAVFVGRESVPSAPHS
jgi:hypothetical protein